LRGGGSGGRGCCGARREREVVERA
jgi:hypothetical protein